MSNIVSYLRTFFAVIFGSESLILTPYSWISTISSIGQSALLSERPFEFFFVSVCSDLSLIVSSIIWFWFVVFSVNLLLVFPYKWIRSVIRKCGGR